MLPGNPKFINQDEFCPGSGGQSWYDCWPYSWIITGHTLAETPNMGKNSIPGMLALWKSSERYQCVHDEGAFYKGAKRCVLICNIY